MLKMSVESVEPGAILAKPIVNDAGIILIAAGVEVSRPIKEKLVSMGITEVFVAGKRVPDVQRKNSLPRLTPHSAKTEEDPRMAAMKRALLAHMEELY